ncbi:MAG: hypothetical protein HY764_00025 [Candidatus Portnoybacteria bacterium]|nr:hypothetical protein [Candidatus Portnoybacteria bacterium]
MQFTNKRKYILLGLAGLISFIAVSALLVFGDKVNKNAVFSRQIVEAGDFLSPEENQPKNLEACLIGLEGLSCVGDISQHPAPNSWAQAVLIPQTHKYPGSQASDSMNNQAEIAQNQIYEIISYIQKNSGINFVMIEGDLYGPEQSNEKTQILAEKIALREKLVKQAEQIKEAMANGTISPSIEIKFSKDIDAFIATLDREIALKGAAYLLKARGGDLTIYGSEDAETLSQCTQITRNYIYQKDRKTQLESNGTNSQSLAMLRNLYMSQTQKKTDPEQCIQSDILTLSSDTSPELKKALNQFQETFNELQNLQTQEDNSGQPAPSRSDNPYNSITSLSQINSLIQESEKAIETTIIDVRNKETAENFAKALKENNLNIGMIQFGAGHTEGLIEELNKLGISVIVATPQEVSN